MAGIQKNCILLYILRSLLSDAFQCDQSTKMQHMFKAKVIETREFYKIQGRQGLIFIVSMAIAGILTYAFGTFESFLNAANLSLILFSLVILWYHRTMKKLYGARKIEITDNKISLLSKKEGNNEIFILDEVDKIILKDKYDVTQLSFTDSLKELTGNPTETFLVLKYANHNRRIDFDIDSHYLLKKLKEVIKKWEKKGYNLERTDAQLQLSTSVETDK